MERSDFNWIHINHTFNQSNMARGRARNFSRTLSGLIASAIGLCLFPSLGLALNSILATTTEYQEPELGLDLVLDPGVIFETQQQLVVTGSDPANPLVVDATPKHFDDMDALFGYLTAQLGATLVRDASGEVIAATGKYTRTGRVVFDDDGDKFESLDYIAAHLGGRAGTISVGGQTISLAAEPSTSGSEISYLLQTDQDCDRGSCIEGHSWLTHRLLYHSVGARTKQISGALADIIVYYCDNSRVIYTHGFPECRTRITGEWEFDLALKTWFRIDPAGAGDGYRYLPASWRIDEVRRNVLYVAGRFLFGQFSGGLASKTVDNDYEVEIGEWTITRDALEDDFGTQIPLVDISGICGIHNSSAGGAVTTSDGWAGDDDFLCTGGDPF